MIIGTGIILISVLDRLMTVTCTEENGWILADVRDSQTRIESQAIVNELDPEEYTSDDILAVEQVRDCIKSAYLSATTKWENHRIAATGTILPDDYPIKIISVREKRS